MPKLAHLPGRVVMSGSGVPRCRAFTLVEVAATIFVLALVFTTSITTMQRAYSNLDAARNISTASTILQTEMEKERLFTWAQISDVNYRPTLDASFMRNPDIVSRFSLTRAVKPVANRTDQMVQVTLTVRWRGYDGRTLSRSFTANFTRGGLNDLLIAQF
jgi:Tfp pilus assembly protein PilV